MKILDNNKIYVQKIDLIYLYNFYSKIPDFIFFKILKECLLTNENNKYDLIEFDKKKEIDFFDNLECILDYNKVKNLNYEEKEQLCDKILNKADIIEKEMMNSSYDTTNYNELIKQWELYHYMYYSLNYLNINDNAIKQIKKEKNKIHVFN